MTVVRVLFVLARFTTLTYVEAIICLLTTNAEDRDRYDRRRRNYRDRLAFVSLFRGLLVLLVVYL